MARPTGRRGEGRARLLGAALALFARHGVNGTSLQMIADDLGVTKAAVYHQFASKSEIVLAVLAPALEEMTAIADRAEAEPDARAAFEATLGGLVELVLDNREFAAAVQRDPAVVELLAGQEGYRSATIRLDRLLIGTDPAPEARVALAMVGGGLMLAGMDRTLDGYDRDLLRSVLTASARTVLEPFCPA